MRYEVGQQLLCFHGPHLYDAKCIRYDQSRGYLVHYIGWNQSWDEWVPESRLLEDNENNRKIQTKLESQNQSELFKVNAKLSPIANKKRSKQTKETAPAATNNSIQSTIETEDQYQNTVEVNVEIPIALRPWLIDDWDLICRKEMLILQPSSPTVQQITDQFLAEYRKHTCEFDHETITQFSKGIIEYFNNMLPTQLLYNAERKQAKKLIQLSLEDNQMDLLRPPSEVYGGIHLLRMFVKMGRVLALTWLNENEMARLLKLIEVFLLFMESNHCFFNMQEYVSAQKAESSMNISDTKSIMSSSNASSDYEETIRKRRPAKSAKTTKRTTRKRRTTYNK